MWIFKIVVVLAAAMSCTEAKPMELEDFLSALSSKPEEDTKDETQESAQATDEELFQFAKRSGLLAEPQQTSVQDNGATNNQNILAALQALQSLKRQQNLLVYSPDYVQTVGSSTGSQRSTRSAQPLYDANSQIGYNDYQRAPIKDITSGSQSNLATMPALNQQPNSQLLYSPQYAESAIRTSQQVVPQTSNDVQGIAGSSQAYSASQRATSSDDKAAMKDDRQGHYAYDGHGYEPAVVSNHLPHARNPGGDHYAHHYAEPHSKLSLPIPSVSIKFDPLGLLKLLLQGIPRPLFNLNGKIFLGLELGKGVGLGKGVAPHAAGHGAGHYGGGRVITIG